MFTSTVPEAPVRQSALIADDDPSMRLVLSASLERLGFEVAAASDGLEALSKALEARFDLVVLDVLMPGADGFEVCTALRQIPHYRLTPILMATGLDDHASIGRAFDAGASDFERKPLNFTLLEHRIRFLMKAADTVRELEGRRVELDFLASHDPLTRLPNRTGLARHLSARIAEDGARGVGTAVFYLDLDGFKNVNDALGHPFGDRLLRTIVERLRSGLCEHCLLTRVGGDEFVLVLDGIEQWNAVENRARAILDTFEEPFRLDDYEFSIGVSIGICMHPAHGQDVDELIRNADMAMYRAKQLGRRRYQVFDERIALQMLERMTLLADLRRAIANSELSLLYQPKVDLVSGVIVGAEALLRWNHPVRGQIPPAVFMPIAEESGLIAEIGHWVVGQALEQAACWCRPPFDLGHVAVNISGPEMWRSGFAEKVRLAIADRGADPTSLQLEITETLAMDTANRDGTLQTLVALASSGMTIAIDDFGTGHSSLPHLKLLPVSTLKVDRSFVHHLPADPNTEGIVRAIIALGNSMRLQLIAEGIETHEQLAWLREAGCRFGQGYLFSRPVTAEAFTALLKTPDPIRTMPVSAPANANVVTMAG